jgi:4'-phosphopantetheinyl transferase
LGKPALAGDGAATLSFNLSHAAGRALCAVCDGPPVGVDIEMIRPVAGALAIAREALPPAVVEALRRVPAASRHRVFLQHWTRREACLKAAGLGLGHVAANDRAWVPPAFGPACPWSLRDLQLPPSHLGALAVAGNLAEVHWMDLPTVVKARRREWSTSAPQVDARDVGSPRHRAGPEHGQAASGSRT